jgi:hypothetical protein
MELQNPPLLAGSVQGTLSGYFRQVGSLGVEKLESIFSSLNQELGGMIGQSRFAKRRGQRAKPRHIEARRGELMSGVP